MDRTICTIEERNQIVEQHLWCIDAVIRQNYTLIVGAHIWTGRMCTRRWPNS